jgi:hypothetical protein
VGVDLDRQRTLGELVGLTFELFGRHLATFLSLTLLVVAPIVIVVEGGWGGGLADGGDPDSSLAVVPGIWLAVRGYFAAQAAVVDGLGPVEALQRSAEVVKSRWWRTLGVLLVGRGRRAWIRAPRSGRFFRRASRLVP